MKLVINSCYGGFSFSQDALKWLRDHGHTGVSDMTEAEGYEPNEGTDAFMKLGGGPLVLAWEAEEKRDDPLFVQVVKELQDNADGMCAELKIVEIPDGVEWEIKDYDGIEWVAEKHRTWG